MAPGYAAQEDQTAKTQANQAAAQEAAKKILGAQVAGRALVGYNGSTATPGTPTGGPQPPAPGQASAPSQPPGPPTAMLPQGGPPVPAPASQPPPSIPAQGGGGAPPGASGNIPEMSLQGWTQRILQTSPGIVNHPEILVAALDHVSPWIDQQGKSDLADAKLELAKQSVAQRGEIAKAQQETLRARQDSLGAQRASQGARADRRLDQGDTREARLAANSAVRNDVLTQRLQLQQQDLQRKVEAGDRGAALAQWRATTDALHKRATEIIQGNSAFNTMSDDDKKSLLAEQNEAYKAQIAAMRGTVQGGGPAAASGTPPAAGATPAPGAPSPAPAGSQAPPAAMLKPGGINIINGVGWRLVNGQPVQVPVPASQ